MQRPIAKKNSSSMEPLAAANGKDEDKIATVPGKLPRRQTRPIGEFGGNSGCFLWTVYIPLQIYHFYGIVVIGKGNFAIPNSGFWYTLYYELPEGIAIRPTIYSMYLILFWCLSQAIMELLLPSQPPFGFGVTEGVTLKNGNRLKYQMNGMLSFLLTHVGVFALIQLGYLESYVIYKQMGALLTGGVITAFVFALWLYIDWGLCWKRHVDKPEFEEDWGVFDVKDFWNDFFVGVARNPRILHSWFKVPLDLKRWWDGRTLTLWVLCNWSYVAAQYYGCRYDVTVNGSNEPVCTEEGDWSRVGWASVLISTAHWYYIFDYNLVEPAYLTTTDIRHDLFGFMLTYGMFGFLTWFYPISFLGFLSAQDVQGDAGPIVDNHLFVCIGIALYVLGMILFRYTNIEKHNFRTFIANLKVKEKKSKEEVQEALREYKIWGKPVDYICTKEGSYLLCSGTWGLGRHFNYIGDMIMCIGWAVACYSPNHPLPLAPFGYVTYFWIMDIHRCFRDEARCHQKYGKDWENYKTKVKWHILPGVF